MKAHEQFAELVQVFFSCHLVNQRDVSPCTVSAYRDTFRLLLAFLPTHCGKRLHELSFNDLSPENLLAFLRYLGNERGNSIRTVNCRLAALRSFLHFAGANLGPDAIAQVQRTLAIPFRRFTRPLLGFLSKEEIQALLAIHPQTRTGHRDHLLFQFLYNTGARVSEALAVRVEDLSRHQYRAVELHGKGRKQRLVPLWKETTQLIHSWLKIVQLNPGQPLFPNRFGNTMTRTAVQQRLQLCVEAAGQKHPSLLNRRITPHTFRHTTAMHLLQSGIATPVIALWLGHENILTTHQYIEADITLKEAALNHLESPAKSKHRYKPKPDLLKFLDSL